MTLATTEPGNKNHDFSNRGNPFDELPGGRRPGGAPFNFAQHLHRLGHTMRFVSSVGRDSDGDELLTLISDAKLDAGLIQRHPEAATGRVAVTVDANGIPKYDIVKNAAYDFIDFEILPQMEPEMVYFGSLIQRTQEGRDRLQAYLATLPGSAMRMYDVNFRDGCVARDILEPSLEQTDILKLNNEELPIIGNLIGAEQTGDEPSLHLLNANCETRWLPLGTETGFSRRSIWPNANWSCQRMYRLSVATKQDAMD